jgi:hypothetical protein
VYLDVRGKRSDGQKCEIANVDGSDVPLPVVARRLLHHGRAERILQPTH